jgi:hypothetical protein
MSIAEGYTITVGCDFHQGGGKNDTFYGVNKGDAYKTLREAGWRVYPSQRLAKCRSCVLNKVMGRLE